MSNTNKKDPPLRNFAADPLQEIMGLPTTQASSSLEQSEVEPSAASDAAKGEKKPLIKAKKNEAQPADPAMELRANKLFYIKRKYVKLIEDNQLKEGFKYTNDYIEHIIEFYFSKKKPSSKDEE